MLHGNASAIGSDANGVITEPKGTKFANDAWVGRVTARFAVSRSAPSQA